MFLSMRALLKPYQGLKDYRIWLVAFLLSYALSGFLLIPYLIETRLPAYIEGALNIQGTPNKQVRLQKAYFNPFLLRLKLEKVAISNDGDSPPISFDELSIDFDTFGLFQRAWRFSKVTLTRPTIDSIINGDGALNLASLIPPNDPEQVNQTPETSGQLPRLIFDVIEIKEATLHYKEPAREEPFDITVSPIDFVLQDLSTLPERAGQYKFTARLNEVETLDFDGSIALAPINVMGQVTLSKIRLTQAGEYLRDQLNFELTDGTLDMELGINLASNGDQLSIKVSDTSIRINNLNAVTLATPEEALLQIPLISLTGGNLSWPEKNVDVSSLLISNARLNTWLNKNKQFNYTELINKKTPSATSGDSTEDDEEGNATTDGDWGLLLSELTLDNLTMEFNDRSLKTTTPQILSNLYLSVQAITLEEGDQFELDAKFNINETGLGTIAGKVGMIPVMADLGIELGDIPLLPFQGHLQEAVALEVQEGHIEGKLHFNYKKQVPEIRLAGDIAIVKLDTISLIDSEPWVRFEAFSIADMNLELLPNSLKIANITLAKPYLNATIFDNGDTRLSRMLAVEKPEQTPESNADTSSTEQPSDESGALPVTIETFDVDDGSMDFRDFSLPINFATHIHSLNGRMDKFSTQQNVRSSLDLKGKIDRRGTANISAQLMPGSPRKFTELNIDLNSVDFSNVTPYSGRFAGYAIESGMLGMDLKYQIQDGKMVGQNDIILEQLTLGDPVESPEAMKLPLKLAVNLLKDLNGNIEINLPVKGDLNDPEVRIGGIIWKAFTNLLIKIAASPFNILAGLIDTDSKEMGTVEFMPGSSELSTMELDALATLGEALALRPNLVLEISPCVNSEIDLPAIKKQKFQKLLMPRLKADKKAAAGDLQRQFKILKSLYLEAFTKDQLSQLLVSLEAGETNSEIGPEKKNDRQFKINELIEAQLIEIQEVGTSALDKLANQRASKVFDHLVKLGGSLEARVELGVKGIQAEIRDGILLCPMELQAP